MSALTAPRNTYEIAGSQIQLEIKAENTIHAGALVAIDSGKAVPAANAAGLKVVGRAEQSGGGGDKIMVKRGVFLYANNAGDAVTAANIGAYCYVADDQTVQASANSNTIAAGLVRGVTADGVYVDTTVNPDGANAGAAAGETAGETAGAAAVAAAGNVRLATAAPATAGAAGVKGDIFVDGTDLYVCTAEDTWIKGALVLATW